MKSAELASFEPMQTILLVDDDPIFRMLTREALSDTGLSLIEAADGVEALLYCRNKTPTLLVVDAVMPNIDGFALCRELRAREATRHTPILMVTGLDDHAALEKAYESGATDFIVKPVDWGSLALRVRYVLRNAGELADLRDEPPEGSEPLAADDAAEPQDALLPDGVGALGPEAGKPLSADTDPPGEESVSILIVDDDPVIRWLARDTLENEGYHVIEAEHGLAAYEICQHTVPGLIVSDVLMPQVSGFELCRLLRQRPETALVPILIATGLHDHRSVAEAYDAGATDFIVKPLNWLILKYRIRYMLRTARTYAEMAAAKEHAEAANRAKSAFLADMSHELRTPLNAVIGFSEIMHRRELGPLSKRYAEYAKIIGDSGSHLLTIINDLLAISKCEAQGLKLAEDTVQIADVVAFSADIVGTRARRAGIECSIEVEAGLPAFRGDGKKLQQILINLLANAIKFTPAGGRVGLRARREPSGGLILLVEDTGIGIPPDKIEVALAPFGQVDSALARKHDGVGVGLPLTKHLVELHDGTLQIDSEPGIGTTVTLRFPPERFTSAPSRVPTDKRAERARRDPIGV
jgi:signal transduction histidine kinase